MEKLYSKIIGTLVFIDHPRPVATVKDLIVDPDTGKLLAFVVRPNQDEVIVPANIEKFNDFIRIDSYNSIVPASEIIRLKQARNRPSKIYKAPVFTEDNYYLGTVYDLSFETTTFNLKRLYVAKSILGLFRYDLKLIHRKHIIEITPKKIIVQSLKISEPQQKRLPMEIIRSQKV